MTNAPKLRLINSKKTRDYSCC